MKNKKIGIILNIIIIVMEIIGIVTHIIYNSNFDLQYYTHVSNLLNLIASCIFLFYVLRNKGLPKWASILKYTATVALTVTFLVVVFVLAPMDNFNYKFYLIDKSMLYIHLLCPILTVVSFILFEEHRISGIKDIIKTLYYTLVYSVVLIILNLACIVDGPYPFLRIRKNSLLCSIMWFLIMVFVAFIVAFVIEKLKQKNKKSIN